MKHLLLAAILFSLSCQKEITELKTDPKYVVNNITYDTAANLYTVIAAFKYIDTTTDIQTIEYRVAGSIVDAAHPKGNGIKKVKLHADESNNAGEIWVYVNRGAYLYRVIIKHV